MSCNAEQAKSLAEHLDWDKTGFLSRVEVEIVVGGKDDEGWANVLEHVDKNADGKITVEEFAEAMTGQMDAERVTNLIGDIDAAREDPALAKKIQAALDQRRRELGEVVAGDADKIAKLVDLLDINKNGFIDREEVWFFDMNPRKKFDFDAFTQEWDTNEDGQLSCKEVAEYLTKEIKEIKNVDGAIEMVESKYKRDAEQAARRAAEEEAELPASEEQYKEFAELIDVDKDGLLSMAEVELAGFGKKSAKKYFEDPAGKISCEDFITVARGFTGRYEPGSWKNFEINEMIAQYKEYRANPEFQAFALEEFDLVVTEA